jgi:hypothetical protein
MTGKMPILPGHDGQDARRHQILFLFAITFENPYIHGVEFPLKLGGAVEEVIREYEH